LEGHEAKIGVKITELQFAIIPKKAPERINDVFRSERQLRRDNNRTARWRAFVFFNPN
jgi:hypothetical protein